MMNAPMESLLAWVLMDKQEKSAQKISDFMNMYYANPQIDAKKRQEYISGLFEEAAPPKKQNEPTKYVTNIEQLKLIKSMQESEQQ